MSSFEHLPRAQRDTLTDLPNRLALKEYLEAAVQDAPGRFAVLEIDIDGFKEVNDLYSHAEGDEFLRNLAGILDEILREKDSYLFGLPVHKSGDEFTIILYEIPNDAVVETIQERIRNVLDDYGIEVSVGGRKHQEGELIEDLLMDADLIMRADKRARKRGEYSSPETRQGIGRIALIAETLNIAPRDIPLLIEMYRSGEIQ
jgi:diguanylate cyclase